MYLALILRYLLSPQITLTLTNLFSWINGKFKNVHCHYSFKVSKTYHLNIIDHDMY